MMAVNWPVAKSTVDAVEGDDPGVARAVDLGQLLRAGRHLLARRARVVLTDLFRAGQGVAFRFGDPAASKLLHQK